ncbi:MAG TPA: hypothetical protein VFO52_08970 [Longimicrobiales bacterium]|nr:hypothetical protein [Longimicrobiales bacterium]
MRRKNYAMALLAMVALSGCISTNAVRLGQPTQYPPVKPEEVQVFLTEADVKGEYDKVAIINAEGNYNFANDERMINAMKKKAAQYGANAIIIDEFKDPSTVEKIADAVVGVGGEKKGKVLAIRLKS